MDNLYSLSFPAGESNPEKPEVEEASWEPLFDIWETEEEWILVADLPGVLETDLQVAVVESQLTISGKREAYFPKKGVVATWRERPVGYFSKIFPLPFKIRDDAVNAELKRGILTISIPKTSNREISSRKIVIGAE